MGTIAIIPTDIEALADELITSAGAEAVVVGGSRAIGRARPGSDWDLGLFYRGDVDLRPLGRWGTVHPPGSWGRIMNGGAWLRLPGTGPGRRRSGPRPDDGRAGGLRVDVLLRDLDAVERWAAEAAGGRFDVDGLPGYVAGIPTYSLAAEADSAVVLRGRIDVDATFPAALASSAPDRWRFNRDFSLHHAATHADRGSVTAALGMVARAVLEEAHARCCRRRHWVLNEKHLVEAAGLADLDRMIEVMLADGAPVTGIVDDLRRRFGAVDPT